MWVKRIGIIAIVVVLVGVLIYAFVTTNGAADAAFEAVGLSPFGYSSTSVSSNGFETLTTMEFSEETMAQVKKAAQETGAWREQPYTKDEMAPLQTVSGEEYELFDEIPKDAQIQEGLWYASDRSAGNGLHFTYGVIDMGERKLFVYAVDRE